MKNKIIRSESIAESNFKFKFKVYSTTVKEKITCCSTGQLKKQRLI